MDLSIRFRPAGARVIHEAFDNEVVIVNLDSGRYYCVQQSGADIWHLMLAGQSVGQMAARLAARYAAPEAEIAVAIDRLCRELCAETLLVVADGAPAGDAAPPQDEPPHESRKPFEPPRLQVYTDMQDLLLLDPIHEVDAAGWPRALNTDPDQPH